MPPGTPKVILSPTEQAALDYHRRNLESGTFQRNADGSLTTFKGAIVGLPEGETLIPTYWHGQERDVPSAVRFAMRSGIMKGTTAAGLPSASRSNGKRDFSLMRMVRSSAAPHSSTTAPSDWPKVSRLNKSAQPLWEA